jgi:hypothetical protein
MIPIMEEQWGSRVMDRLSDIGKQSMEWNGIIESFIIEPLKKKIEFSEKEVVVEVADKLPRVIWLKLFLYIFHGMGVQMISRKNLDYFLETYENHREKSHRFHFSNGYSGTFKKHKLLITKN